MKTYLKLLKYNNQQMLSNFNLNLGLYLLQTFINLAFFLQTAIFN